MNTSTESPVTLCQSCKDDTGVIYMNRLCCVGRYLAKLPSPESALATAERWASQTEFTVDDMRQAAKDYRRWQREQIA